MNTKLLQQYVMSSKLNKVQIAEQCGISRTTLDNVLDGADAKISTIESLAKTLGFNAGELFGYAPLAEDDNIRKYQDRIKELETLLDKRSGSTKIVVEFEVNENEFVKMGLKDKVVQVLNKEYGV